jgi:hypothetical protein
MQYTKPDFIEFPVPRDQVIADYAWCAQQLFDVCQAYRDYVLHAQDGSMGVKDLYRHLFPREKRGQVTFLGSFPEKLEDPEVRFATLIVYRAADYWEKLDSSDRMFLTTYPDETTHANHLGFNLQTWHLDIRPTLAEKYPDFQNETAREKYERDFLSLKNHVDIRLNLVPVNGKPVLMVLDSDDIVATGTRGGMVQTPGGTLKDLIRDIALKDFHLPPRRILFITTAQEPNSGGEQKKQDLIKLAKSRLNP